MKFKIFILILFLSNSSFSGPFSPAAGQKGSTAISANDPSIVAWAVDYENFIRGERLYDQFNTPKKSLNIAGNSDGNQYGYIFDIVSLGEGGSITLIFDPPIMNGPGFDFAVFENSFDSSFLELAWIEVSSNGLDFFRFENISLTSSSVSSFGYIDPTNIYGLAGKYEQGFGTPFDLESIQIAGFDTNLLDLNHISHIKVIDIVGDGNSFDSRHNVFINSPIFDPYPTNSSAGFDLDAIGVINQFHILEVENIPIPTISIFFLSLLLIFIKNKNTRRFYEKLSKNFIFRTFMYK